MNTQIQHFLTCFNTQLIQCELFGLCIEDWVYRWDQNTRRQKSVQYSNGLNIWIPYNSSDIQIEVIYRLTLHARTNVPLRSTWLLTSFQQPPPIYQGRALSLTSALYSLINFQTANKMTSQPSILAEPRDRKNPDLYYWIWGAPIYVPCYNCDL